MLIFSCVEKLYSCPLAKLRVGRTEPCGPEVNDTMHLDRIDEQVPMATEAEKLNQVYTGIGIGQKDSTQSFRLSRNVRNTLL